MSAPVYKTQQRYLRTAASPYVRQRIVPTGDKKDSNLWYHTYDGRFRQREPLKRGLEISDEYKKTGKFNNEATHQNYQDYMPLRLDTRAGLEEDIEELTGKGAYKTKLPEKEAAKTSVIKGGGDRNIFYRRRKKRKQPILRKRVFKDLEPGSRVVAKLDLDLTKKEKQATMITEGIQGMLDLITKFIRTPKLHPDGRPLLNPITNKPEYEIRSVHEILAVAHTSLMKALENNNIVPSDNIKQISLSFTQNNVQNILYKFQAIVENNPAITQTEKKDQFLATILQERLKDMSDVKEKAVEVALGDELVDEKEIKIPDNWDEKGQEGLFPTRGFKASQWVNHPMDQMSLNAYILNRSKKTGRALATVTATPIELRLVGLQFSKGHILDLDRLKFRRKGDVARYHLNDRHPSLAVLPGAPAVAIAPAPP